MAAQWRCQDVPRSQSNRVGNLAELLQLVGHAQERLPKLVNGLAHAQCRCAHAISTTTTASVTTAGAWKGGVRARVRPQPAGVASRTCWRMPTASNVCNVATLAVLQARAKKERSSAPNSATAARNQRKTGPKGPVPGRRPPSSRAPR